MAFYSFIKATASRRSPSLLLLQHSRRFTSTASVHRSIAPVLTVYEQLSPAANSYGCLSSSATYTADHAQIASPTVLHLLQSRLFSHTSAAGSPTLLQTQFRRFASKPDEETLLAELKSALRGDANLGSSKLEEIRKKLDEIHRTMKESNSERIKHSDSVGTLWERRMRSDLYYRILFKEKYSDDYWAYLFLGCTSGSRFLGKLVIINGICVVLLSLVVIGILLIKNKVSSELRSIRNNSISGVTP